MRTEDLIRFERFIEEAKAKHERGRKEHGQEFSKKGIDYVNEIKDELLDIWNYSSLDNKTHWIGNEAMKMWIWLDKNY